MDTKKMAELSLNKFAESIGGFDSDAYHDYPVSDIFMAGFVSGIEEANAARFVTDEQVEIVCRELFGEHNSDYMRNQVRRVLRKAFES